jgi:bifunctional DNA-binding transcriptional regulator/antitoxin component of YhaV-PrlF toxin-antitoxin module
MDAVRVTRRLDGKGRLILPGDFREAAGFAPDEQVEVALTVIDGKQAFVITKKELKKWQGSMKK